MIRSTALLFLLTPAMAYGQSSDDPWGAEEANSQEDTQEDTETDIWETREEAPTEKTTDDQTNATVEPADTDEVRPEDASDADAPMVDAESSPPAAEPQKTKRDIDYGANFKAAGFRIQGYGTGTGVSLGMKTVLGRAGGTTAGTISTNYQTDKWGISASLPFVMHRVPGFRFDNTLNYSDGLGNLAIDAHYVLNDSKVYSVIALETHFNLGSRAYTWVNDGDEIWPSTGVDVAWQGISGGKLKKLYRLAMGLHFSNGNQPYPSFFPRFSAAFGLDRSLNKQFGITAEASLNYWDTSPFELSAFVRADPLEGLRVRGGIILPVATWAGLVPADQEAGLSESTFLLDMRYAF